MTSSDAEDEEQRERVDNPEGFDRNGNERTLKQQKRATAYRARRDAQYFFEWEEEKDKQRIASRAFQARKSPEERTLAAKKAADYQRARRTTETPAQRNIRRAKHREYLRVWRARKKAEKK